MLAQAIVREGMRNVAAGANPMELKAGIEEATQAVVKFVQEMAKPLESGPDIAHVAGIAGNDPEIGTTIADAMAKVGKDGVITGEASKTGLAEEEAAAGMQVTRATSPRTSSMPPRPWSASWTIL